MIRRIIKVVLGVLAVLAVLQALQWAATTPNAKAESRGGGPTPAYCTPQWGADQLSNGTTSANQWQVTTNGDLELGPITGPVTTAVTLQAPQITGTLFIHTWQSGLMQYVQPGSTGASQYALFKCKGKLPREYDWKHVDQLAVTNTHDDYYVVGVGRKVISGTNVLDKTIFSYQRPANGTSIVTIDGTVAQEHFTTAARRAFCQLYEQAQTNFGQTPTVLGVFDPSTDCINQVPRGDGGPETTSLTKPGSWGTVSWQTINLINNERWIVGYGRTVVKTDDGTHQYLAEDTSFAESGSWEHLFRDYVVVDGVIKVVHSRGEALVAYCGIREDAKERNGHYPTSWMGEFDHISCYNFTQVRLPLIAN